MASLLRRSKLWDSYVPPPGFEGPRTAELKFLIFFATMAYSPLWWHPTEVATRVGSGNRDAARLLCLKLAGSGWLDSAICHIQSQLPIQQTYTLVTLSNTAAYDKRPANFVMGFKNSSLLRTEYNNGGLLGMFRIAKNDRRPLATRIFDYLIEHPEPIHLHRLRQIVRARDNKNYFTRIEALVKARRLQFVESSAESWLESTCQLASSEWLKQETKRRLREEKEQEKKAGALRKRRRTLKKKAKKRKRPSRKGALEL